MLRHCLFLIFVFTFSHTTLPAHETAQEMADMAKAWLSTLSSEEKAAASFAYESEERLNWHFVPKERKGLPFKKMTQEQRLLGYGLLNTGLSNRGQMKVSTIMSLEEVLFQLEGAEETKRAAARAKRDPENYFISIFGTPAMTGTWGWRVEGHHLSLNFTIKDGELFRATPSFFGSNPGEVRSGLRAGVRPLAQEEDLGRALAKTMNDEQWKKCLVDTTAPKEVISEAKTVVTPLSPEGLNETDMKPEQRELLQRLLREHLFRVRPEIAEVSWKEIQADGNVHFAWAGGRERGEPHYYRVQGKSFLLEYDNTQNDANHVHAVWRDFDSDFGSDLLQAHLKAVHPKPEL